MNWNVLWTKKHTVDEQISNLSYWYLYFVYLSVLFAEYCTGYSNICRTGSVMPDWRNTRDKPMPKTCQNRKYPGIRYIPSTEYSQFIIISGGGTKICAIFLLTDGGFTKQSPCFLYSCQFQGSKRLKYNIVIKKQMKWAYWSDMLVKLVFWIGNNRLVVFFPSYKSGARHK